MALLVALFIVRGLFELSILPPFEGWDEYQHIAFIQFYNENGREPVLGESLVPRSLYPELVRFPHPPFGAEQVRRIGALSYEQFWAAKEPPSVLPRARDLPLYQAQQPPLYYKLVAPFHTWLMDRGGILASVTGLRLLNILFGAAAVAIAAASIGRILKPGPHRYIVGLLIATQPLYLINCTRVANDALAVLLGTIATACLLNQNNRRWWPRMGVGGLALGGAILAKTNLLGLMPFVVFLFAWMAFTRRASWGRAAGGLAVVFVLTAGVTFSYFKGNLDRYGMMTPLQESLKNKTGGRGPGDLFRAIVELDWRRDFAARLFRQSLWRGGWSMLGLEEGSLAGVNRPIPKAFGALTTIAVVSALITTMRRKRRPHGVMAEPYGSVPLFVLCGGMTAALAYHALQSQMALKNVGTNAWYGAVVFPWLIALIYAGLMTLPWNRVATLSAAALLLTQVAAEIYGTCCLMPPAYYGGSWSDTVRNRIDSMHLEGMGAGATTPCAIIAALLACLGIAVWMREVRHSTATQPPTAEPRNDN
ncbi:MAG: phospholipid carrier-dependent glycosyltransferase [Planctomycetes bacterium]|nr:phospholipid carrier-dependent glycosyltransferase [Planctomycetota bacterium]